jgi:hypothetical protein
VEAPSSQATAGGASIGISGINLPTYGAYVLIDAGGSNIVTGTAFHPGPMRMDEAADGTISVSLQAPSSVGAGIHTANVRVNVCVDSGCSKPIHGSPWIVPITYVVDPSEGVDYQKKTLPLSVSGIVWSDATQKLYALVPSYSSVNPGTIVEIDPFQGVIERALPIANLTPGTLTISDDGQYLYVALTGSVQRIRTSDLGVDLTIPIGSRTVGLIREAPSSPHTLAIRFDNLPRTLSIFDDAVERSQSIPVSSFSWGADSSTVYAYLTNGLNGSVERATLSSAGLTVAQTTTINSAALISGIYGELQFANGILYWSSGATFDPTAFTLGTPFSLFASTQNTTFTAGLAVDVPHNRAYFAISDQPANGTNHVFTIQGSSLSSRAPLWLARFPAQNLSWQFARWGTNGLAFVTDILGSENLVLISGPIVTQ